MQNAFADPSVLAEQLPLISELVQQLEFVAQGTSVENSKQKQEY